MEFFLFIVCLFFFSLRFNFIGVDRRDFDFFDLEK